MPSSAVQIVNTNKTSAPTQQFVLAPIKLNPGTLQPIMLTPVNTQAQTPRNTSTPSKVAKTSSNGFLWSSDSKNDSLNRVTSDVTKMFLQTMLQPNILKYLGQTEMKTMFFIRVYQELKKQGFPLNVNNPNQGGAKVWQKWRNLEKDYYRKMKKLQEIAKKRASSTMSGSSEKWIPKFPHYNYLLIKSIIDHLKKNNYKTRVARKAESRSPVDYVESEIVEDVQSFDETIISSDTFMSTVRSKKPKLTLENIESELILNETEFNDDANGDGYVEEYSQSQSHLVEELSTSDVEYSEDDIEAYDEELLRGFQFDMDVEEDVDVCTANGHEYARYRSNSTSGSEKDKFNDLTDLSSEENPCLLLTKELSEHRSTLCSIKDILSELNEHVKEQLGETRKINQHVKQQLEETRKTNSHLETLIAKYDKR